MKIKRTCMDVSYSILRKKGKREESTRIDLSMKLVDTHRLLTHYIFVIYIYLVRYEYILVLLRLWLVAWHCMSSVAPWDTYDTPRFSYHE